MPAELISILAQIPIVAVFIWYSDRINRQFMNFLENQRKEDRQVIAELTAEVKGVADCLSSHQDKTGTEHAVILDRLSTGKTTPRKVNRDVSPERR